MKHLFSIRNRISIILLISVILGLFLSLYELPILFRSDIIKEDSSDHTIILLHLLFTTALSALLIYINTIRMKRLENLQHFFYSALLVALFWGVAWTMINPLIQETNSKHITFYEDYSRKHNIDVWDSWERHQYSHYFHDSVEDWLERFVFLFASIYALSRIYNLSTRKNEMEKNYDRLKNENLQSQISALNNQINPHFIFNALNALHSLIVEEKKDKSLTYLSNLSNVFRYILQSERKELVSLTEEFSFLETYRFMLSVKYEQKLRFDIQVDEAEEACRLPVLSLLPIIENVIKHNEISNRYPMVIYIRLDQERYLTITNEKRKKLDAVDSGGIGLKNLNNRFKLLVQHEIKIESNTDTFSVHLPLVCV